jgi:hypothetical protein
MHLARRSTWLSRTLPNFPVTHFHSPLNGLIPFTTTRLPSNRLAANSARKPIPATFSAAPRRSSRRRRVTDHLIAEIARAIVHLNFNEPEQARDVLLVALSEFNFAQGKENSHGNAAAA